MEAPEGLPRLRVHVGRWFGWAERSGLPGGCPLFGAAFELDDTEGPVRDYLVESQKAWTGLLRRLVGDA
jgi:hypothetical protein